nr:non-ribosomal peptide synthetase [Micromonospora sp. MH33]
MRPSDDAIVCGDERLSYSDLGAMVGQIVGQLPVEPGQRVGIIGYRDIAVPACMLAVHLRGHSFVVLDPDAPPEIDEYVRETTGINHVLDPRSVSHSTPSAEKGWPSCDYHHHSRDEAYVLYTSGSTGKPKGVSVSQRNLTSSNQARLEVYRDFGTPRFLLLSPFFFDSSFAGIWGTLAAGGTLVIATEDERRNPAAIAALLDAHRVTHLLTIPNFYAEVLHCVNTRRSPTGVPTTLRVAVCAGEALAASVIEEHFRALRGVVLFNEYGPTECTVWSTFRRYDTPAAPTIGNAIPGTDIYLFDEGLSPVPAGAVGQISIAGPGVANGYVADAVETGRRFVTVALPDGRTRRVYLTGDLGRWNADGELEFLGRLDSQLKIRGARVNPEAVEQVLMADASIRAAAMVYDADALISYVFVVRATDEQSLDEAQARSLVAGSLGRGHVPDRVIFVDELPRTGRDKVDRVSLLSAARTSRPSGRRQVGTIEAQVTHAWERILGVTLTETHSETSFFELGGNSISILRLSRELAAIIGSPVSVAKVYRCDTLSRQAELLRDLIERRPEYADVSQEAS